MPNECEVHTQLVRPASKQQRLDQRPLAKALAYPESSLRVSAAGADGHALPRTQVARDGRVDQALVLADIAADEHQITLFRRPTLHLALQRGSRGQRAANHQQPRRVFVQAMDDAWAQVTVRGAQFGKTCQQAVDQRSAPVAGRGMDDDARGLVDHHHSWVLEDNVERHLILGREIGLPRNVHDLDEIATGQPLARLAGLAVEPHSMEADQTLPLGSRKLGPASVVLEERVQAFARGKWRDDEGDAVLSRWRLRHGWFPRSASE